MKLQKENKFKQMIITSLSKAAIVAGISILGFTFFPNFMNMINTKVSSQKQTEIVKNAINPNYQEINENVNLDENYVTVNQNKYDFQKLRQTNQNIKAIIEGTCFEGGYYPIVETKNQDEMNYYLYHSVDNQESSLGAIFTDYNTNENSQIQRIWGHNFHNGDSTMFTKLANICQNQEAYDSTIGSDNSLKLYTENDEYDLDVVACIINNPLTQHIGTYDDQNEFLIDMNNVINSSLIKTNVEINPNDEIIILTTCTNLGSSNDPNNRISVYCKKNKVLTKEITQNKTL